MVIVLEAHNSFKLTLFLVETSMKQDDLEKRPYDYKTKLNLNNLPKQNDANNLKEMKTYSLFVNGKYIAPGKSM